VRIIEELLEWKSSGSGFNELSQPTPSGRITLRRFKKLALCHEDVWETGGILPPFLTSVLGGGEWLASLSGYIFLWKEPPVPTEHESGCP
jgi:hypothetical protein